MSFDSRVTDEEERTQRRHLPGNIEHEDVIRGNQQRHRCGEAGDEEIERGVFVVQVPRGIHQHPGADHEDQQQEYER